MAILQYKKTIITIGLLLVLLITLPLLLRQDNQKVMYFEDITLVRYEQDSFFYKQVKRTDKEITFKQFYGVDTLYSNDTDNQVFEVDIDITLASGDIKILKMSESETLEIAKTTKTVRLYHGEKIKIVGKNAYGSVKLDFNQVMFD